jgi:hypothetical protein
VQLVTMQVRSCSFIVFHVLLCMLYRHGMFVCWLMKLVTMQGRC